MVGTNLFLKLRSGQQLSFHLIMSATAALKFLRKFTGSRLSVKLIKRAKISSGIDCLTIRRNSEEFLVLSQLKKYLHLTLWLTTH